MLKIIFKDKRGLEPSTLTWIAAMFIIFFILIIFLAVVLGMAGSKYFKGTLDNPLSVKEAKSGIDLTSTKTLISLLKSKIDFNNQEITIKDLVLQWAQPNTQADEEKAKNKIEQQIKASLEKLISHDKCYSFYLKKEHSTITIDKPGLCASIPRVIAPSSPLNRVPKIIVYSQENNPIEIKLFLEEGK